MVYLFTRTRRYEFYLANDPISSPNARFVSRNATPEVHDLSTSPSYLSMALHYLWRGIVLSGRFLLNLSPPKDHEVRTAEKIQVLEKWDPQEFEMTLFAVYSPVHAALWWALTSANWIWILMLMVLVYAQVSNYVCLKVREMSLTHIFYRHKLW